MVLNVLSDTETEDGTTTIMSEANDQNLPAADETWETVGEDGSEGVLIVPPVEVAPPPAPNSSALSRIIELDLSFPESVPSEIGSVHNSDPSLHPPEDPRNEIWLTVHRQVVIRRRHLPILAVSIALVLLSALVSYVLVLQLDRSNLNLEILQLKRELLAREALERKQRSWYYSKPDPTWKPEVPPPPPEVCKSEEDATTLVDNCWVQAKANVQLGRCAEDAKTLVQGKLNDAKKKIWDFAESWVHQKEAASNPSSNAAHSPDVAGVGISFQGMREAAKVLMSGVAVASLTSLLLDESIAQMFDQPRNEDPPQKTH